MFLLARAHLGLEKLGPAPPLTRTFWVLPDQLVKTTAIAETSKSDFYPDKKISIEKLGVELKRASSSVI